MQVKTLLPAAAVLAALSGCGTLYKLDVTATTYADVQPGSRYVILSGDPDMPVGSADFTRYASQLERALDEQGYVRVGEDGLADAQLAIYVSADVSDPAKSYHTVKTAVFESPYIEGTQAATRAADERQGGQSGQVSKPTPLDQNPQEVIAGYERTSFATTVYTKELTLLAIDLPQYLRDIETLGKERAVPREIWSIDVETVGSPSSLQEAMPVMIAASQPWVGENTGQTVQVTLSESDSRVRKLAK